MYIEAQNVKVNNFLNDTRSDWDKQKLRDDVVEEDYEQIVALKISSKANHDWLGWQDEIYTVKSGYWVCTHLPDNDFITPTQGIFSMETYIS